MERSEIDLRQEFEERLRFETLLTEISAQFINLPANQIGSRIEDAQFRVCDCLGLDISALWQWSAASPRFLLLTHLFSPPGGPSRPERLIAEEVFPWHCKKMMAGEILAFSTEDMPPEAIRDQEALRHYGVKSSVVIPLSTGDEQLIGILSFDTLQAERAWSPEIVNRLSLVAQLFCNALVRQESDRILRQSEARLRLAAESAEAGLWELDVNTGIFWATEKARAIFGYEPKSIISMERFEKSVCPVDLTSVRQVIAESFNNLEPFCLEYRIVDADNRLKWIYSCARPYVRPDSSPFRLMGASIDISNRKAVENNLRQREERLSAAIDVAALGFYELNADFSIDFMDDRFRTFIGINREDESRAREFWLEHIHPDDLPAILDLSRQILEEGLDTFATQYRYRHPERGITWLHHLSRVLERSSDGKAQRVVGVMRDITKRKRAEDIIQKREASLEASQKDLQRLAGKLISGKEEELRRLSRELHDDLTQRLAAIAIEAGKMELQMSAITPAMPERFIKMISHVKEQLISVSEDVHRISRQLHPSIIDDLGLVRAIESECKTIQDRRNIKVNFKAEVAPEVISKDIALCLYRIVQEALNNIISHSRATSCEVDLKTADNLVFLTVNDEGVGFDPLLVKNEAGLGLSSMRERVLLVQGVFSVRSQPGQGTALSVSLPLYGDVG